MAPYNYDFLSAQDNSFLLGETANTHMHVGGIQIFERGALATGDGGVDFATIRAATDSVLHRIPRYRQKLRWTPIGQRPIWIDDADFDLDYHIRHTSLPRPGSLAQLRRLAGRIMGQQLDRERPLWEIWVVEGLQGDRFATILKTHHCVIDGVSGVDLVQSLLSIAPNFEIDDSPSFMPRPAPSTLELAQSELLGAAGVPLRLLRGLGAVRRDVEDLSHEIAVRAKALGELAGYAVRSASETPINGHLGPHRRLDWLSMSLDDVKAVRKAADCTVNDVVLTTVTGAFVRYFQSRGVRVEELDFRVSAPVSTRSDDERGKLGNRVSSWIIQLPLDQPDPLSRLRAIHDTTQRLKESNQAMGVEMMMQVAEWTPPVLLALGARAASGPINTIVTNVPGPQFPLYLLGARLLESYPVVPLLEGMGLGVALFSYDGRVFWGFNADYRLVPDLLRFAGCVRDAFAELAEAVEVKLQAPK